MIRSNEVPLPDSFSLADFLDNTTSPSSSSTTSVLQTAARRLTADHLFVRDSKQKDGADASSVFLDIDHVNLERAAVREQAAEVSDAVTPRGKTPPPPASSGFIASAQSLIEVPFLTNYKFEISQFEL